MIESEFVKVAVDAPISQLLTYRIPRELAAQMNIGALVSVPLGRRKSRGVLISEQSIDKIDFKLSAIKAIDIINDEPAIGPKTLKWLKWLSEYYFHPPGQVYSLGFAPGSELRKKKEP